MKVHIVTEPSWICKRLADHLAGNLDGFRVRATTEPPRDAKLTYYLSYLFREFYRPVSGSKSVALFTHYIPGKHQRRYDQIAYQVDHCIVLNSGHEKYLSEKVGKEKVSRVHLPVQEKFYGLEPLRVGWFHRSPEGYDRRKRTDLVDFVKTLPWVRVYKTDGNLTQERVKQLMATMDVFLTTSDQESGPASFLEGLSLGKHVIIPMGVGLANEYAHVDGVHLFKPGDKESLKQALVDVYRPLRERYEAVSHNTVDRWRSDHVKIFKKVLGL